jgi:starch synthase
LIGLISRLVNQKGLDLISNIANELLNMDLQFVVLGSGEGQYENLFRELSTRSNNIRATIGFDAKLAERIYSGCDMFLMPSRFEPCGLGQLIALRYGTIPIVRATGGLADTVQEYNLEQQSHFANSTCSQRAKIGSPQGGTAADGFVFENYNSDELLDTIKRAIEAYKNKKEWQKLVKKAMKADYSCENSANKYIYLYNDMVK